jgi:hypothetical protein
MTRISEAQTRKRFIDQRLKAAGWPLTSSSNPKSQDPAALREYPTAHGPAAPSPGRGNPTRLTPSTPAPYPLAHLNQPACETTRTTSPP